MTNSVFTIHELSRFASTLEDTARPLGDRWQTVTGGTRHAAPGTSYALITIEFVNNIELIYTNNTLV